VSLIESALEKLRRVGDAGEASTVVAPLRVNTAALVSKVPTVIVAPAPDPESVEHSRHIEIDLNALRDAGYLPAEGLERRFADHYRQIKRPLIERALTGSSAMRLIMVSSALPGDGKTFTSINLALSMARERDASVLLVDADAPKARISHVLGVRGEPGLLEALSDHSLDVESLVAGTNVRGLQILPAGGFVESATELMASGRMDQIAARLVSCDRRRLVVIDSAPLLVSSEARVLTRIAGQIVLVARAGVTPRRALADAVARVEKSKLQGLILNDIAVRQGGGYYYGYSGYDAEGEPPSKSG
jgi:protein-tyrosine kinase